MVIIHHLNIVAVVWIFMREESREEEKESSPEVSLVPESTLHKLMTSLHIIMICSLMIDVLHDYNPFVLLYSFL